MEFSFQSSLAGFAIALSCARNCEQFIGLLNARRSALLQAVDQSASLTPAAGVAALVYAQVINADLALLIATWLSTTTAVATLEISKYFASTYQVMSTGEAGVISHE